jgi:hypothetical protein
MKIRWFKGLKDYSENLKILTRESNRFKEEVDMELERIKI